MTKEELREEIGKLMQFCKHNQEAFDRICKIARLSKDLEEQSRKEAVKIIKKIENPFPFGIFLPVSREEYTAIHHLLLKHFNIPLDRVSADLMRMARNNLQKEILEKLQEKNENRNKKN